MENIGNLSPLIPLNPGSEVLLEIESLKLRIKCMLVGMETGQYIIVRLSPNDLIGNFRSEAVREKPVIVRYLFQGAVYGYRAEVLNIVTVPARLFFLSYPQKIEELALRSDSRYECILPAYTMFGNDIAEMVIVDLSMEGCQCMIRTKAGDEKLYGLIQVNKTIDIRVQFPGGDGKYELKGKVRNISKGSDRIMLGVMFEGLSQTAKAKIDQFISLISKKST